MKAKPTRASIVKPVRPSEASAGANPDASVRPGSPTASAGRRGGAGRTVLARSGAVRASWAACSEARASRRVTATACSNRAGAVVSRGAASGFGASPLSSVAETPNGRASGPCCRQHSSNHVVSATSVPTIAAGAFASNGSDANAETAMADPGVALSGEPESSTRIVGITNVVLAVTVFDWVTGPSLPGLLIRIEILILIGRYCVTPG